MFDAVLDYPVQALSYHDREAVPSLAEPRKRTNKCLVGGIGHTTTLFQSHRKASTDFGVGVGNRNGGRKG